MPVFECSRCNNLSYSASRFATLACDLCASPRQRILDHAFSFDDARAQPRATARGDHCCVWFDAPDEVAPLCAEILRRGVSEGARVIAYPQAEVRERIVALLGEADAAQVEWLPSDDVYGPAFDPDEVVERFHAIALEEQRPVYILGGSERPLSDLIAADDFRRFERLATHLAVELGLVVVCLFDRGLQPREHLAAAAETHPLAAGRGGSLQRNEDFVYASSA